MFNEPCIIRSSWEDSNLRVFPIFDKNLGNVSRGKKFLIWIRPVQSVKNKGNKNVFQWDAYCRLKWSSLLHAWLPPRHACCLPCMAHATHTPHGQTDTCENITFPQLLLWAVTTDSFPRTFKCRDSVEFFRYDDKVCGNHVRVFGFLCVWTGPNPVTVQCTPPCDRPRITDSALRSRPLRFGHGHKNIFILLKIFLGIIMWNCGN